MAPRGVAGTDPIFLSLPHFTEAAVSTRLGEGGSGMASHLDPSFNALDDVLYPVSPPSFTA
jgi:hypothetical protein